MRSKYPIPTRTSSEGGLSSMRFVVSKHSSMGLSARKSKLFFKLPASKIDSVRPTDKYINSFIKQPHHGNRTKIRAFIVNGWDLPPTVRQGTADFQ